MKEADLIRQKAKTMKEWQLRNELARIERVCATSGGAYKRYITRYAIITAELKRRTK